MSDPTAPHLTITQDEPVMSAAGIQALISAAITMVAVFGAAITGDQRAAIIGMAGALLPLAFGVWQRSKVSSVAALEALAAALAQVPAALGHESVTVIPTSASVDPPATPAPIETTPPVVPPTAPGS